MSKELKSIYDVVCKIFPPEVGVKRVEQLGPFLYIFIQNPNPLYETENEYIKNVSKELKRKIFVRVDENYLRDEKESEKIIREMGKDAGIKSVNFVREFGEVYVEAEKPGVLIGKNGEGIKNIMLRTNWSAIILRVPAIPSQILASSRKSFFRTSKERKTFLTRVGKVLVKRKTDVEYIRVVMLGGFREVGRSCSLIETNHSKILIDCGVNTSSYEPKRSFPYINLLNFPINELDAVVITHAHTDHIAFLPYLFNYGYEGPVYLTYPTKELMALMQQDYLKVSQAFLDRLPYDKKAIENELKHCIPVHYNTPIDIAPDIKLTFQNAGHILGSAIVHLHIGEGLHNIVYTGDFKFSPTRLFSPAYTNFSRIETLFIESTYGGRDNVQPPRRESEKKLIDIILQTVEKKGKVLIPVFAVGRSQEVLLVLDEYIRKNKDFNVPIYIDGMVIEATAIHTAYLEYLNPSLQTKILRGYNPFKNDLVKVMKGLDREQIVNDVEPGIILAPSGMLNGGPSYEYLKMLAEDEKNTLIIVGYQAEGTVGRKIQEGEKLLPIIDETGRTKSLEIKMRVETVEGFSGHSDRRQLMAYIKNLSAKPKRVFVMHGESNRAEQLANDINKSFGIPSIAPYNMEAYRLR